MQAALGEIQEGIDLPLYYGATLLLPPPPTRQMAMHQAQWRL